MLAAHRGGIKHVIIPVETEKDLADIPDNILRQIKVHPVETIEEVLKIALVSDPTANDQKIDGSQKNKHKKDKKMANKDLHTH